MYDPIDRHGATWGTNMSWTYPNTEVYEKRIKRLEEEIKRLEEENRKLKKENEFLLDGIICKTSGKVYAEFSKS